MEEPEDLIGELTRWLAEARVDAAAASRARHHWLRQQLAEEATTAGVLLDAAEAGRTLLVRTAAGRRHRGRVRAVADDFCALRTDDDTDLLLSYDAIVAFQALDSGAVMAGARAAALAMSMIDALSALVVDRPRVLVVPRSGEPIAGELRSVGQDVLVLRLDGEAAAAYVPANSLAEVILTR